MFAFIKNLFSFGKRNQVVEEKIFQKLELNRERTSIVALDAEGKRGDVLSIIRSNRCHFNIGRQQIVVRAKYMHIALRYAGALMRDWEKKGAFTEREEDVDYETIFKDCLTPYDLDVFYGIAPEVKKKKRRKVVTDDDEDFYSFADDKKEEPEAEPEPEPEEIEEEEEDVKKDDPCWVQVFLNGRCVYKTFESAFIEVIEKCTMVGELKPYDQSLEVAQHLFEESGQSIDITSDAILSVNIRESEAIFHTGMVNRMFDGKAVFSFTLSKKPKNAPNFVQVTELAANLSESVNLTYDIEMIKKAVQLSRDAVPEKDILLGHKARARRNLLERRIDHFEGVHNIHYRPERPILKQDDDYSF